MQQHGGQQWSPGGGGGCGGGCGGGGGGGLRFSPQEREHYEQLFRAADQAGTGRLDGLAGAGFLTSSGVAQDVLHRIWDISDFDGQGFLTPEKFFVACRLVAHAQAGQPPGPQLASMEPQMLPDFRLPARPRQPSETSSGPCSPAMGARRSPGVQSEYSDQLQPVIATADGPVRAAARAASRSPSPRAFSHTQWVPTQRERRKYATLFKRVDWDGDGFVQGSEASDLLSRSRLPREVLGLAWDHSDADGDGRLSFREFVCLTHLVTCALRGAPLPQRNEPLPSELREALMNMESPEVLIAEREASRSRSTSPAPSGVVSPSNFLSPSLYQPPASTPGADAPWGDAAGGGGGDGAPADSAEAFGTAGFGKSPGETGFDEAFGGGQKKESGAEGGGGGDFGFGAGLEQEFDDALKGSKKEKKKKKKDKGPPDDDFDEAFGFGPPPSGGSERLGFGGGEEEEDPFTSRGFGGERSPSPTAAAATAFATSPGGLAELDARAGHAEQVREAKAQFEATVAADREVTRQLRREVDELQDELRHMQEVKDQLRAQLDQEQRENDQQGRARSDLEGKLEEAKGKLMDLQESRRAMNLESLSLRRDREHCTEELEFLQQMGSEEEQMLETSRQANQFLETAYLELEAHAENLELQRRSLAGEVQREKDLVRQDERGNAELRNRLERAKREQQTGALRRKEAQERERLTREMQEGGRLVGGRLDPAATARRAAALELVGGHSWAKTLAVNSPNPVAMPPPSPYPQLPQAGLAPSAAAAAALAAARAGDLWGGGAT